MKKTNKCLQKYYIQIQRHIPLVLGFLLLVVPFLPATNALVTVGFVVAERVLYIPRYLPHSICSYILPKHFDLSVINMFILIISVTMFYSLGGVLLVVYGIQLIWQQRPNCRHLLAFATLVLIASGSCKTFHRNREWKSREALLR